MPQSSFVRPGARLLGAALAVALGVCAGVQAADAVVALPDGYYLQPDKAFHTLLVDRKGHKVLDADVAAYAVSRLIVAGAEGDPPADSTGSYGTDQPFSGGPDTRYFVLDTEHGKLEQHLAADAWHKRLQELGVPEDFHIYPPLRWQQL